MMAVYLTGKAYSADRSMPFWGSGGVGGTYMLYVVQRLVWGAGGREKDMVPGICTG